MSTSALRRSVTLAGVVLILMIIAAGCYEAWEDYRTALAQSEHAISALSLALSEQTERMIQEADLVLEDFVDWRAAAPGATAPGDVADAASLQARLRARLMRLPFIVSGSVIGVDGRLIVSTRDGALADINLVDEEVFLGPQRGGGDGLYVGAPRIGRRDGYLTFALSRRLSDGAGKFAGVVAARVGFDYLSRFYAAVDIAPDVSIRLVRDDGIVLARYLSTSASDTDPFGAMAGIRKSGNGLQRVVSTDGEMGLVVRRKVNGYPMSIDVVQPMSSVLAVWRSQQVASAVRTGVLALLACLLLAALDSALRRRELIEDERSRLEGQLRATQQAETLGMFAASIAHDFNNVLAAIIGYAELARHKLAEGSPAIGNLDRLLAAGERARSLVQRVLTFDLRRGVRNSSIALEPIIQEVLDQVRATLPANIDIQTHGMDDPGRMIIGDSTEVHQIVMNLCSNAVHAMARGGTLELKLQTVAVHESRELAVGRLKPGSWLSLSIADTGLGMSAEQIDTIFDSFATTKERGQGTGLGLAVVRNIIVSMGGAVSVDSRLGAGSRFQVYWPLVAEAPAPLPKKRERPVTGRGETIMVVDDEPALVAIAEELLASIGYEPIGFTDAEQALDALKRDPGRFDALLTDERMPLLRGTELARAARNLRRELPVVLVTGHREEGLNSRAQAAGVAEVLDKPLHIDQLETVFGQVLRTGA